MSCRGKHEIGQTGNLIYDGVKKYHADIFEHDVLYGSGDYEDPPEIANDREVTCYYIWYQDLIDPDMLIGENLILS